MNRSLPYVCKICVVLFCFTYLGIYAHADTSEKNSYENKKERLKNPEKYLLPPEEKKKHVPEPYKTTLAPWAYFTVRFVAVTVGSFPFSILLGGIGFDTYKTIVESQNAGKFQSKYLPLFFGGAEKPQYTSEEVGTLLFTALGISFAVGITDLIIALVKHYKKQEINELFLESQKK